MKNKMEVGSLDKYIRAAACSINSLEDLKIFGIPIYKESLYWSEEDVERGFISISAMNQFEESKVHSGDWQYHINRYNFRGTWDFTSPQPKIGFFGCSFTFGEGISDQDSFVNHVATNLNLNPFNFGIGGSSLQRIARTFSAALKVVDLDYAVFTLPHWHRQMFLDHNGNIINLVPNYHHQAFEKISRQLTQLDEKFYCTQAVSWVNWIHDLAENKNIKILLSSWDHTFNDLCKQMYPNSTLQPFPNIDDKKARDGMHPGPLSQKAHADQIIKAFYDNTWI